jgi:hypothetical protein
MTLAAVAAAVALLARSFGGSFGFKMPLIALRI